MIFYYIGIVTAGIPLTLLTVALVLDAIEYFYDWES